MYDATEPLIELTIFGEPASKSNSRQLVTIHGRPAFIKSKKALSFLKDFAVQCPTLNPLLEGDLAITMTIHYRTRRPDLDESVILDALQGKIYGNDRQIKEKHVFHAIDKTKPRVEISISLRAGNHQVGNQGHD
jgi:Holliday junction resolvase RusA-like endonuclease